MPGSPGRTWCASGRLLQHGIEAVEDRHAPLEEPVIVPGAGRQSPDGEIEADRLGPGELSVVKVGLVHDLREGLDATIVEPESLDERLERAVLAVVPEVRVQNVEGNSFARG